MYILTLIYLNVLECIVKRVSFFEYMKREPWNEINLIEEFTLKKFCKKYFMEHEKILRGPH